MIKPRRSQAWYVDGSRSGILAWLINSDSVPLEKKSTTRMTERGDLRPLQPLPRTPNARCGNAGGCQRRECKTAGGGIPNHDPGRHQGAALPEVPRNPTNRSAGKA